MTNILSRVYNSTLGVPQQLIYRTIRAMKDDDIDLFSREGLLAPELLPLVGMAFSHETDATIDELIGKDTHWAGKLALDIFADPATYLTAGATGIFKSAKTVRAGIGGKALKEVKDAGIDASKMQTVGDLRKALNDGIQRGAVKNRRSRKAAGELAKLDDGMALHGADGLLTQSSDKLDLLITVPGLARWGAQRKAPEVIQKHKSWFGYLNHVVYGKAFNAAKGSRTGKAVANKLGEAARAADGSNVGFATTALANVYRISKSFSIAKKASQDLLPVFGAEKPEFTTKVAEAAKFRAKHGATVDKINLETLGADIDKIRKNLVNRREALEKARVRHRNNPEQLAKIDAREARMLKDSFKGTNIPKELRETFIEQWRGLMGDGVPGVSAGLGKPMDFAQMVGRNAELLRKNSDKATALLDKSKVKFKRFKDKKRDELIGENPHWITELAYNAGQAKAKLFEFTFGTNKKVTAKFIESAEERARMADANLQRNLEANQHRLVQTLKKVSDLSGVSQDEINKVLNISAEGTALPADFAANLSVIKDSASTAEQVSKASRNISDWLNKQRLSLEALGEFTRLDKRAESYLFGIGQKQTDILIDAGRHWSRSETLELLARDLPEHLRSKYGGRKLHELTDDELHMLSRGVGDANRINDPKMVGKIRQLIAHRKHTKGQLTRPDGSSYPLSFRGSTSATVGEPLSKFSPEEVKEILKRPDLTPQMKADIRKANRNRQKGTPVGKADEIIIPTPLGDLSPEMQAYVDLRLALDDVENGRFTTQTILRFERGHKQLASITRENALRIFSDAGAARKLGADELDELNKGVEALFGISEEASRIAHRANGFTHGAPVGYLPRFKNPDLEKKISDKLGDIDKITAGKPNAANLNRRFRNRDILLEDLNNKLDDIADAHPEAKAIVEDVRKDLKEGGLELKDALLGRKGRTSKDRLIEDHLDIMFTSMGRDLAQMNAAKLIDDTFNHAEASRYGMVGGKVIDLLDGKKQRIPHGATRKKVTTQKERIKETIEEVETDVTPRYAVVERADGKQAVVDLTEEGFLDATTSGSLEVLRLGEGETLGNAFIRSNLSAASLPKSELKVGEYLAVGSSDVLGGFKTAWTPNPAAFQKGLAAYDKANFLVKRFQTILRPAHHVANQISGFFQSSAAGASVDSIAEAWVDVHLMIHGGSSKMRREFEEQIIGRSGLQVTNEYTPRTAQYVHALAGNRAADDLLEEGVGQLTTPRGILDHGDIWQEAVDGGLLAGTFAQQELILGAGPSIGKVRKSREKLDIKYADDKTRFEKMSVAWDDLGDAAQTMEIQARMATLYALIYDGHTLPDAIELAKRAHVDYSKLGYGERGVLKRAIPYYTFNRHYVPWALGQMAKSPAGASVAIKAIEQSGVMGVDPDGKVVFNNDAFEMDLGRANANIDALMTVASLADMMSGSFTVEGQQSLRPPGMMALFGGGVPGILVEGLGVNTDENLSAKNAFGAFMDATFAGRLVQRAQQAVEERSTDPLMDWSLSYILPAKFTAEPKQSVKFAISAAERHLGRLNAQFQEAKSEAERQRIQVEAQRVQQAVQTTVEDFS